MFNHFHYFGNKMFIENLLGSRAKVKVLRVLSEARTAYSLKGLKAETELSLSIVHRSAEELAVEGILLRIKGTGKERLYKFDTDSPFAAAIFELFKTEKTRQRKEIIFMHTWSVLEDVVSKIRDKSNLVILFGSQARGDATLDSDIDILIIPKNLKDFKDNKNQILDIIRKINAKNKINPTLLELESFNQEAKDNTLFYRNIKKDGIILYISPKVKKEVAVFLNDISYKEAS